MAAKFDPFANLQGDGETAFDAWLQKIEIKMLLSLLPPNSPEQQEIFKTLLKGAFTTGISMGAASITCAILAQKIRDDV
jgi:hypothetical protein